jgi:hypothetical protein
MNRSKEEKTASKLRNVTQEQFECIVANHTDLNVYPMTAKELYALQRNRYRRLLRLYRVTDENEVLHPPMSEM